MKICLQCEHRFDRPDWLCTKCGFSPAVEDGVPCFAPELMKGGIEYDPQFFAWLAAAEQGHFWFEARNGLIQWALRKYSPDAKSLLEVGCGTGFVLLGLSQTRPQLKLTGAEALVEGLAFARQRVPHAGFMQMDARKIPFADEFDVVAALDVIEHIADDATVIEQMTKAVRPGGVILTTVPQHMWLWTAIDDASGHQRRYRRADLIEKIVRAGLKVERVTSFVSLLVPLMWAARLGRKHQLGDMKSEFRLSRITNTSLKLMMGIERQLIRMGASFPAGGSLLLVARKESAK
jgi:SAM-dependent methyltransferase